MTVVVNDRLITDLFDIETRTLGSERSGANSDASDSIGSRVQWRQLQTRGRFPSYPSGYWAAAVQCGDQQSRSGASQNSSTPGRIVHLMTPAA
jgi:hypothetical protein